jgi:hypothetical protein
LIEEMLMMRPNLRLRMPSITGRHMLNSEFKLVLITAPHCSGRHAVEHGVAGDAGIVDQHLDRAEIGLDLLEAGGAGIVGGDVPLVDRNAGRGLELLRRRVLPP